MGSYYGSYRFHYITESIWLQLFAAAKLQNGHMEKSFFISVFCFQCNLFQQLSHLNSVIQVINHATDSWR